MRSMTTTTRTKVWAVTATGRRTGENHTVVVTGGTKDQARRAAGQVCRDEVNRTGRWGGQATTVTVERVV
jgi:hypothetical protein